MKWKKKEEKVAKAKEGWGKLKWIWKGKGNDA